MNSCVKAKLFRITLLAFFQLIFCFILTKGHSESVHLECLSMADGLSNNLVYCITQDSFDFMWFGTQNGLNRYDGYKFTTFVNDPLNNASLSSNLIFTIYIDQKQNLWIGTSKGLNLYNYDNETFSAFQIPDQWINFNFGSEITAIFQENSEELWIGTNGSGLFKFDIEKKNFIPINPFEDEIKFITTICEGTEDNVWIGTNSGLINLNLKNGKINKFIHDLNNLNTVHGSKISSLFLDKNNTLWIGHENGIDRLEINKESLTVNTGSLTKFQHYILPENQSLNSSAEIVSTIYRDKAGILWVGTHGAGLYYLSNNSSQFKYYRPCKCLRDTGGLSSSWINKIIQNKNGTIWVGTNEGLGKLTFEKHLFNKYEYDKNKINSICQGEVKVLLENREGIIWIGTWGNGICKLDLDSGNFSHIKKSRNHPEGLPSNYISEIYEDNQGTIWITVDNNQGLYQYSPTENSFIHYPWKFAENDNFTPKPVTDIFQDSDGIFWIGTGGEGLIRFDSNSNNFSIFKHEDDDPASIRNNHIYSILQPKSNILLICTANGLDRFIINSGAFEHLSKISNDRNADGNDRIYSVLKGSENIYWLGTDRGLSKIIFDEKDSNIYSIITARDGLAGEEIYGILEDNQKLIWLLTNKGLSIFYPKTNQIRNFTTEDGCVKFTKELSHGSNAHLQTTSGYLFFGGVNGLTYYMQNTVTDINIILPPVLITDFKLNDKSITPLNSSILDKSITSTESISFSSRFLNFTFDFAILDFTIPSKNQYAYMLKGWDKDWIYSGNQHRAIYTAIPPGNYTFIAKGSNHEGLWNNEGVRLAVNIYAVFWETWWFRSISILFLFLIFIFVHYYQLRKVKREKNIQEDITRKVIDSQEMERKRIASELHDSLGQNLQFINSEIVQLGGLSKIKNNYNFDQLTSLIKDSLKEVREIAYDLHPHQLEHLGLQKAIESAIKKLSNISNISFNISIDKIDNLLTEKNRIHLFRIVQEAIYNIYKHAEAKNAFINIYKINDQLVVDIKDDGKGFNLKQIINNEESVQRGLGISNMYERAKLINGDLSYNSETNRGTHIKLIVRIP